MKANKGSGARSYRFRSEWFACPVVAATVSVHRSFRLPPGQGREELVSTDCSRKHSCPIAAHHGNSATFDWDRCAYVIDQAAQTKGYAAGVG